MDSSWSACDHTFILPCWPVVLAALGAADAPATTPIVPDGYDDMNVDDQLEHLLGNTDALLAAAMDPAAAGQEQAQQAQQEQQEQQEQQGGPPRDPRLDL